MLVIGFLTGTSLENDSFADADVLGRAADACRRLHAGPRFSADFDMFARQAAYLRTVREQGFALPAGYDDHTDDWAAVRRVVESRPQQTVPCNNDLLAGNFIDDGERVWLIDYEYSGNNDVGFELGNTCTECEFSPEQVEAYAEAYFGTPTRGEVARVRLGSLRSEYGWALWGFIQAATSPLDFDFHAWGMHRFEKAARTFTSDGFAGCSRTPPVTELPARARVVVVGGGVIGCSTAYHLTKLGVSDVLLRRAGPALRRHDLARRRAGRPAESDGERDPSGAVLGRAVRPARGGDRARDRLQQRRWAGGGPHRGPDGAAAPYRG